jgi:DNA-binding transcriptional LysR family regulator
VEIYQLKSFISVAREGHLTRASEQLHLTQSTVSKQIKALEDELGVLLFERQTSGMLLTKAGRKLLPIAERTLANAVELLGTARGLRGAIVAQLKLGTIIDPEFLRLGEVLGRVLQYYPMIDVKLQHGISGWVLERVRAGELDAGFYLGSLNDADVELFELGRLNYVVIGPVAWREQLATASLAALAALPWVGTPVHSSQRRMVNAMFAEQGLQYRVVIEADQEASMIDLVRQGLGLCLMRAEPALAASERGELCIWPLRQFPCQLSLVTRTAARFDPALGALMGVLSEVWGIDNKHTNPETPNELA